MTGMPRPVFCAESLSGVIDVADHHSARNLSISNIPFPKVCRLILQSANFAISVSENSKFA
jgi:hypothetical protein